MASVPLVPAQDILELAPHARVPAQRSPNSFPFFGTVLADARPGAYRARVRYRSDGLPGATPLELVSNAVAVTVRGGNLALWQCQREQQRLAAQVAGDPEELRLQVEPPAARPLTERRYHPGLLAEHGHIELAIGAVQHGVAAALRIAQAEGRRAQPEEVARRRGLADDEPQRHPGLALQRRQERRAHVFIRLYRIARADQDARQPLVRRAVAIDDDGAGALALLGLGACPACWIWMGHVGVYARSSILWRLWRSWVRAALW